MGMPLTSFQILNALLSPGEVSLDQRKLQRALEQFKIFACVLHDPTRDATLHSTLTRDFDLLDSVTGNVLLFFALVEPSRDWLERAGSRHYFSAIERALNLPYARATPLVSADPDVTVCSVALRLGIPVEDLPCILAFTADSREVCWFPTSAATVEQQLGRLARAAESYTGANSLSQHLDQWRMRDLGQEARGYTSVARTISEVLAAEVQHESGPQGSTARRLVRAAIDSARQEFRDLRSTSPLNRIDDVEPPSALISAALQLVFLTSQERPRGGATWPWPSVPAEKWERDSAATLRSLVKLEKVRDLDDFSPLVVCYGRALESELNASVVQQIRQNLGIRMPDYYRRYQPGAVANVETGREPPVKFNKKDRFGNWSAPSMGESRIAAKKASVAGYGDQLWQLLLRQWKLVHEQRNQAAHGGAVVTRNSFEICRTAFNTMVESGIFPALFQAKVRLRET